MTLKQLTLIYMVAALFLWSCDDDNTDQSVASPTAIAVQPESPEPLGKQGIIPPAKPVDEDDYFGRMMFGMRILQEQFTRSSADMRELGKVTILLDEKANMIIRNEINDQVKETKVNLKDLDLQPGAFRLIADEAPGDRPALVMRTINFEPKVEQYVDGKLEQETNELTIYLADRLAIEKITPAMRQSIAVAYRVQ